MWQSLSSFPDGDVEPRKYGVANLVALNSREFICGAFNGEKLQQRLLKFNTFKNEWTEYLKLPKYFAVDVDLTCLQLNCKHNILYITKNYERNQSLIKLNIDTNEYEEIQIPDNIGMGQLLLINDDIHLIGGENNTHSILQPNQTEPQILFRYADEDGISYHRSIYSSKTDTIYTFGGYIHSLCAPSDNIYSFDVGTNTQKLIDLKMPEKLDSFGCIMTRDGRYVITFGGCDYFEDRGLIFISLIK